MTEVIEVSDYVGKLTRSKRVGCSAAPFLTDTIMGMVFENTTKVATMAVDKYGKAYANPSWLASIELSEAAYSILHEDSHDLLGHGVRRDAIYPVCNDEQALRYNIAADLVVQQLLKSLLDTHKIKEPAGIVRHTEWQNHFHPKPFPANLTVEQYVSLLEKYEKEAEEADCPAPEDTDNPQEGERKGGNYFPKNEGDEEDEGDEDDGDGDGEEEGEDGDGGEGEGEGEAGEETEGGGGAGGAKWPSAYPKEPSDNESCNPRQTGSVCGGERQEHESEATLGDISKHERGLNNTLDTIKESLKTDAGLGTLAGVVAESLAVRFGKVPDPFKILRSVVATATSSGSGPVSLTRKKPARIHIPGDGRLYGKKHTKPHCVVVVDTSGSMNSNGAKEKALNVVAKAISHLRSPRICCADTFLRDRKKVTAMCKFKWTGGGGTDMGKACVEAYEVDKPSVIVLITDGLTPWPEKPMRCKLIVALVGKKLFGRWKEALPKWAKIVDCQTQEGR